MKRAYYDVTQREIIRLIGERLSESLFIQSIKNNQNDIKRANFDVIPLGYLH